MNHPRSDFTPDSSQRSSRADSSAHRDWEVSDQLPPPPLPDGSMLRAASLFQRAASDEVSGQHIPDKSPPIAKPTIPGFEILELVGMGGMGVVYRAKESSLNRFVAIKIIPPGLRLHPHHIAQFRKEAESVARVRHKNIVEVFQVSEHDSLPYMVMEFANGGTLAKRLNGTPLAYRDAAELVATLADAVDHAHSQGVVHRDLKPGNVLLMNERLDQPKIADFGLAKWLQMDAGNDATCTGAILGTPSYMAPEQAAGNSHLAGPPADIYALGAILYELVTGRPPFRSSSFLETLDQVRSHEPVSPSRLQPGLPKDLRTICLKCLDKRTHRRYGTAAELAADLRRFLGGEVILARSAGYFERTWKWAKRKPAWAATFAVLMISVLSVALLVIEHNRSLSREVIRATASEWKAERQKQVALRNLQNSYETLNEMLESLANSTKITESNRELAEQQYARALQFFDMKIDGLDTTDPQVRSITARMLTYSGSIHVQLLEFGKGEQELTDALVQLEELVRQSPTDVEIARMNARCHYHLGRVCALTKRYDDAQHHYEQSITILGERIASFPNNSRLTTNLADSLGRLAETFMARNRPVEACEFFGKSSEHYQALLDQRPRDDTLRLVSITALRDFGAAQAIAQKFDESIKTYQLAEGVCGGDGASSLRIQLATADLYLSWCLPLAMQGKHGEAVTRLEKALDISNRIIGHDPPDKELRQRLHGLWRTKAWHLFRLGQIEDSFAAWGQAYRFADGDVRDLCKADLGWEKANLGQLRAAFDEVSDLTQRHDLSEPVRRRIADVAKLAIQRLNADTSVSEDERAELLKSYSVLLQVSE